MLSSIVSKEILVHSKYFSNRFPRAFAGLPLDEYLMLRFLFPVVQDLLEEPRTIFTFLLLFYEGAYVVVIDDIVNASSIGGCPELNASWVLLELPLIFLNQFNNLLSAKSAISLRIA